MRHSLHRVRTLLLAAAAFFCGSAFATDFYSFTPSSDVPASGSYTQQSGSYFLTYSGLNKSGSRSKTIGGVSYKYAVRCTSITVSGSESLGSLNLAFQNGSSSGTALVSTYALVDGAWELTDTVSLAGNAAAVVAPENILSKAAVDSVKFEFSVASYVYNVSAASSSIADGAPAVTSISPASGSNISSEGTIELAFDELVKVASASSVVMGSATINSVVARGNKLLINYSGFTASADLLVNASAVTDLGDVYMSSDYTASYLRDETAPSFVSISPAEASTIHIQDLGESDRMIKITFDENIAIDDSKTVAFGDGATNASVSASVSGAVLTLSYKGLAYNATNTLTIPGGYVKDLSGNAWSNSDKTFTFYTGNRDATAPSLTAQSMASGATAQPIGGAFTLSFDEQVVIAAQTATIDGKSVVLSNNNNVVGLTYTNAPYSSEIKVVVPAGAITDTCGNAYAGTSFSFYTVSNSNLQIAAVVAADGSGDYTTIQEALDAISDDSQRSVIYVKPGVYKEKLVVAKKNVSLIGENPDKVIITWDECSSTSTLQNGTYPTGITSTGTDASYSMLIAADNFYGENFTVRNDYDYQNGTEANKQSVALEHINSDKAVLKNVKMYSFQDTYYPKTMAKRVYLKDCFIQGGTDYIFGSGTCFMDGGIMKNVPGGQYMTAPSDRASYQEFGIVISDVNVSYADTTGFGDKRLFYLGRPWKTGAMTSYINTTFETGMIQPAGWATWSGALNDAVFSEYGSVFESSDAAADLTKRVDWSSILTSDEAARYNKENAFNYGAGNAWNPLPYCTEPDAVNDVVNNSGSLSWTAPSFAVGYVVFKNGAYYDNTTDPSYTDASYAAGDVYEVAAYNAYGALSATSVSPATAVEDAASDSKSVLVNTLVDNNLCFTKSISKLNVVAVNGSSFSFAVNGTSVNVSVLPAGSYVALAADNEGRVYAQSFIKK